MHINVKFIKSKAYKMHIKGKFNRKRWEQKHINDENSFCMKKRKMRKKVYKEQ